MSKLYALKLEEGRYYIGITDNVERRVLQHYAGMGASWTKKYPPVEILEERDSLGPLDEEMTTKQYMMEYGIDKVRGGPYTTIDLDLETVKMLEKSFWSASDCCLRCGRSSHFAKACFAKTTVTGRSLSVKSAKRTPSRKRKATEQLEEETAAPSPKRRKIKSANPPETFEVDPPSHTSGMIMSAVVGGFLVTVASKLFGK